MSSKLSATAKEWVPSSASTSTPQSNTSTSTAAKNLRSDAREFVPGNSATVSVSSPPTNVPPVHIQQQQQQMYYYDFYGYPNPYYVYDPNMYPPQLQYPHHQIPHHNYDTKPKSRSNSMGQNSEHHNNKFNSNSVAKATTNTTLDGNFNTSLTSNDKLSVEDNEPKNQNQNITDENTNNQNNLQSQDILRDNSSPSGNTTTNTTISITTEGSGEGITSENNNSNNNNNNNDNNNSNQSTNENGTNDIGWERGKNIIHSEEKSTDEITPIDNGANSWKRGISMAEKTPSQMLLRNDGIIRYSRETIISLHTYGEKATESILILYGARATHERSECKSLSSNNAPRSPSKRGGHKRREEPVVEEPHPDEKLIFHEKREDVFRYDPNRVVDKSSPDAVLHKATEILNKLSVDSFERLSDQFLNIGMETEAIMSRVVDLIVSKAQLEEPFCFMYADLCKKITDKWNSPDDGEDNEQVQEKTTENNGAPTTQDLGKVFRTRLLNRCQEEFQQDREAAIQAIQSLSIPDEDKEEKLFVLRKRYTGHMRFVGEIYMKDLIKPNKMHLCIDELLRSRDEEKLSCLCKLLQTIGKKLEAYDQKKKKTKFKEYFQLINELSDDRGLSTKIRFGFKDLMEMRNNNWTARRVEEKAKKLSEIRGDGSNTPSSQGPSTGPGVKPTNTLRTTGPQDARLASSNNTINTAVDEWSVVGPGKGKKVIPASKTIPGRSTPSSKAAPAGSVVIGNKFSALTSSGPSSSSSQKNKSKTKTSRDDDEDFESNNNSDKKYQDLPQVTIPDSSSFSTSTFSPDLHSLNGPELSLNKDEQNDNDGTLDETTIARVIAVMNEFFLNDLVDEAIEVMKELVHPNSMGIALKSLIRAVLEKKTSERIKFNTLIAAFATKELLSKDQCVIGLSAFLNDFDDIVMDVPLVADYFASILSALYVANGFDNLSFSLHLPDENNFSYSMNQYSLIVKTAIYVKELSNEEVAKSFFNASLEGKSVSELDSMAKEQVQSAIDKSQASFLV